MLFYKYIDILGNREWTLNFHFCWRSAFLQAEFHAPGALFKKILRILLRIEQILRICIFCINNWASFDYYVFYSFYSIIYIMASQLFLLQTAIENSIQLQRVFSWSLKSSWRIFRRRVHCLLQDYSSHVHGITW